MATLPQPATIIGGPVSPYVRKVLAVCELKGVSYRLDPIVPFFGSDAFSDLSPLRRVPVYMDDQVSLCDSTVICEYLDERFPNPRLMPASAAERARARWIEEFADTCMGDVFLWRIFYEAVINPAIWQRPRDKEKIARVAAQEVPGVMGYLEGIAPAEGFVCGDLATADLAVAVFFRNLLWARAAPDASRWPKTVSWVERVTSVPAMAKVTACADRLVTIAPDQHRQALAAMGMPLTEATMATLAPRRGPMTV